MNRFIYKVHLIIGIGVSLPVLAWALSGLLYALPNMVEGGSIEKIDTARIKVAPAEAITKANDLAGRSLPTTALTLLMKDGRPQYQSIGGLGCGFDIHRCRDRSGKLFQTPNVEDAILSGGAFLLFCRRMAGCASYRFLFSGRAFRFDRDLSKYRLLDRTAQERPTLKRAAE